MAASERFDVFVHGRGAHGAMPHLGNDPIVSHVHTHTYTHMTALMLMTPGKHKTCQLYSLASLAAVPDRSGSSTTGMHVHVHGPYRAGSRQMTSRQTHHRHCCSDTHTQTNTKRGTFASPRWLCQILVSRMCLSLALQVAGSAIVLALQTLVSRETGPLDSSVVTVGVFDSGIGAGNIIASQVRLEVRRV